MYKQQIQTSVPTANDQPGTDKIPAEVLRADPDTMFGNIWEEEQIPSDWKEDLLIKMSRWETSAVAVLFTLGVDHNQRTKKGISVDTL